MFPLRFVDCLSNMYAALRSFLVVINTNLLFNDKPAFFVMKIISVRFQACATSKSIVILASEMCYFGISDHHFSKSYRKYSFAKKNLQPSGMLKCRDMWLDLYKHCFDADTNTMTFVELYGGMCALFSAFLQLFAKQQPLSLVLIFASIYAVTYPVCFYQ